VNSDWGGGYCASVDVINDGTTTVNNWTVTINFPNAVLSNAWNGTGTAASGSLRVSALAYDAVIPPKTSVNFGFCATTSGTPYVPSVQKVDVIN
jgi:cellulase/cellobiase CelA1